VERESLTKKYLMKHSDEIKKKTEELTERLKETEKELKNLRKNCKHLEYKVKDINFGSGMLELRKVCNFCDEKIGFPTKQDLKDNGYSS
jgi:predicted nuclease with TOPRIM domain